MKIYTSSTLKYLNNIFKKFSLQNFIYILLLLSFLILIPLIFFKYSNKYINTYDILFKHEQELNDSEKKILEKYLKTEYESAHIYLNDKNIYHFYIIQNETLISYFHIAKIDNKYYAYYVFTNKNYRKNGYIKKLFNYSFEICKQKNINNLYYITKKYNNASINTAKSLGFYFLKKEDDNIHFIKNIIY